MRIAEITGNPILQAVSKATLTWLFEYYRPLLYREGREVTTLKEHRHVVDALEAALPFCVKTPWVQLPTDSMVLNEDALRRPRT